MSTAPRTLPPVEPVVGERIKKLITDAGEGSGQVIWLTGNGRALLRSFDPMIAGSSVRWNVIDPMVGAAAKQSLLGRFTKADVDALIATSGAAASLVHPLAGFAAALLRAGRARYAGRAGTDMPRIDGQVAVFDLYWRLLEEAIAAGPAIVLVELADDQAAQELIAFLDGFCRQAGFRTAPFVLVLSIDDYVAERHRSALSGLPVEHFSIVGVPPLDVPTTMGWLGCEDEAAARLVVTASGGRTDVAATVVSRWMKTGFLEPHPGGVRFGEGVAGGAALEFERMVHRCPAPDPARTMLHVAALFGESFPGGVIAAVAAEQTGVDPTALWEQVAPLVHEQDHLEPWMLEPVEESGGTAGPESDWRWSAPNWRDQALRDLDTVRPGAVASLRIELLRGALAHGTELRRFAPALKVLAQQAADPELMHQAAALQPLEPDPRLHWLALLSASDIGSSLVDLAELASAARSAATEGYLETGTRLANRALEALESSGRGGQERADVLHGCGVALCHAFHWDEGSAALEAELELRLARYAEDPSVPARRALANCYHELGWNRLSVERWSEASDLLGLARTHNRWLFDHRPTDGSRRQLANTLYEWGVLTRREDLALAREAIVESLAHDQVLFARTASDSNRREVGLAHHALGGIERDQGDLVAAEEHFEASCTRARELVGSSPLPSHRRSLAIHLVDLADVRRQRGDSIGAEENLLEALGHFEELFRVEPTAPYRLDLARALLWLARIEFDRGELTGAHQHFGDEVVHRRSLLAVAPEISGERQLAFALFWWGRAAVLLGDRAAPRGRFLEAAGLLERASAVEPDRGLEVHLANTWAELGDIGWVTEDDELAETSWGRVVELRRPIGDAWRTGLPAALYWWGLVAARRGDLEVARSRLEEAASRFEIALAEDPAESLRIDAANAWDELGNLGRSLDDLDLAETAYGRSIGHRRAVAGDTPRTLATSLFWWGHVAIERDDAEAGWARMAEAAAHFEAVAAVEPSDGVRIDAANAWQMAGHAARAQEDTGAAIEAHSRSVEVRRSLAEDSPSPAQEAALASELYELALAENRGGHLRESEEAMAAARRIFEELRNGSPGDLDQAVADSSLVWLIWFARERGDEERALLLERQRPDRAIDAS